MLKIKNGKVCDIEELGMRLMNMNYCMHGSVPACIYSFNIIAVPQCTIKGSYTVYTNNYYNVTYNYYYYLQFLLKSITTFIFTRIHISQKFHSALLLHQHPTQEDYSCLLYQPHWYWYHQGVLLSSEKLMQTG